MTKAISTGSCAAFIAAASIAAMAQAPAPAQKDSSTEHRITVTGCLKQAPTTATDAGNAGATATAGTTGTAGAASAATDPTQVTYVLAGATASPAAPDASGAAAPSTSAAPGNSTEPAQTYRLIANPTALAPHIGKKVELTGTLDQSESTASRDSQPSGPVLRVQSGKVLAAACQN